ncbi:MAG: Rieske 2Fe-2S domain-containing protein [Myxococcota bacterium]
MSVIVDAGLDDLAEGAFRVVRVPGGKPPRISVIVAQTAEGYRAYWNVCRHLPIPLDSGLGVLPDGLVCISHGARYRAEDGVCTEGPCRGEKLFALAVRRVEGRLVVEEKA